MSFGDFLGNAIGAVVKVAVPMALESAFPLAAMIPGLNNLVTSMYGAALNEAIGQIGKELGLPSGMIKDIQEGISKQTGCQLPVDDAVQQHVNDKCGGTVKSIVDELIKDLKNTFEDYKNKHQSEGAGGSKGGKGGGFRELMALLSKAEEKQFQTCKEKAQAVVDALGIDKSEDGAEAKQFTAMDESKTEAQILQMLCSAVSEVNKSVSGALQTSGRA